MGNKNQKAKVASLSLNSDYRAAADILARRRFPFQDNTFSALIRALIAREVAEVMLHDPSFREAVRPEQIGRMSPDEMVRIFLRAANSATPTGLVKGAIEVALPPPSASTLECEAPKTLLLKPPKQPRAVARKGGEHSSKKEKP